MSERPVQYHVHYEKPQTNHVLHLLLTVFTAGFWLPVWVLISVVQAIAPPEQKVTGVYGDLPDSKHDVLNPRRATPEPEMTDRDRNALVGVIGGVFTMAMLFSGYWFIALPIAAATGALLWYRTRPATDQFLSGK